MTSPVALMIACAVAVLSILPNRAAAYCRLTTESEAQRPGSPCATEGVPLSWIDTCLSYAIDSRGSQWMDDDEVEEAVRLAFETWETVDCDGAPPNLVFKSIGPSTCRRPEWNGEGNVNTIAFLDPWRDPCADPDALGYEPLVVATTVIWRNVATGEIFDADMMINDQLASSISAGGPFANCPDTGCPEGSASAPGPTDLQNLVTHEVGHFIGLGHSDVLEATMFAETVRSSVSLRTLAQDDINAVCDIFPPGGLDRSCNAEPIGGLRLDCEIDDDGEPFLCDASANPPGSGGGGCSAGTTAGDHLGVSALCAFCAVALARRRRDLARSK